MVLFLEDSGGFRLSMTPQQHFNALNKEPTLTRVLPPASEYRNIFQEQWKDCFENDDGSPIEKNWRLLERILAPLYFPQRDWVPEIPNRLKALQRRYPLVAERGNFSSSAPGVGFPYCLLA